MKLKIIRKNGLENIFELPGSKFFPLLGKKTRSPRDFYILPFFYFRLIYHSMTKNVAIIEQNIKCTSNKEKHCEGQLHEKVKIRKCFLIVDTMLVENEPYNEC